MNREDARDLLYRYVRSDTLRKHCLATAAIMKHAALHLGEDAAQWEMIGVLHDIDYEMVGGDMERHGIEGSRICIENGFDETAAGAIARHNYLIFGDSDSPLDLVLQAADNISGFVIACAMVKGGSVSDVTPKTVRKKLKDKTFAAGCNREKIRSVERLMDTEEFYALAIGVLQELREDLDLR